MKCKKCNKLIKENPLHLCYDCLKEKIIKKQKKAYSIKIKCLNYLGNQCNDCGLEFKQNNMNTPMRIFHFHHIDPSKKEFSISRNYKLDWIKIKKELDKCLILCSNCHSKYNIPKENVSNDPLLTKARLRERRKRQKIKQKIINYMGNKCERCGINSTHPCIYELHHKNPKDKDSNISRMYSKKWEDIKLELDKCILLCSNCHGILHEQEYFEKNNLIKILTKKEKIRKAYDQGPRKEPNKLKIKKEYMKEYRKKNKAIINKRMREYLKEYRKNPENIEKIKNYMKKYNQSSKGKERYKKHANSEKRKNYLLEYRNKPEVKERIKLQQKKYYERKKQRHKL